MLCTVPDDVPSSRGRLGDHRALEKRCSAGHPTTVNSVCQIQIHLLHSQSLVSERFTQNLSMTVYLTPAPNRLVFSETLVFSPAAYRTSLNYDGGKKAFWILYVSTLAVRDDIAGQHWGLMLPLSEHFDSQMYPANTLHGFHIFYSAFHGLCTKKH